MNNTSIANATKKVLAAILVSGALLIAAPSFAKATANIEILSSKNQATLQFAGSTDDNAMLFNVELVNPNADKFTITVTTADGDVLFTREFNDKNFAKKFKLLKSEEIAGYNFTITSKNKDLEQTFSVAATKKTVDSVIVTKL